MSIDDQIRDDDQQFEQELRRFMPLEVAPLPSHTKVVRRHWLSAAVAALILLTLGIGLLWRTHRANRMLMPNGTRSVSSLTLGESQTTLIHAASFDAAMNQLERDGRLREMKSAQGKRSAFEVLGRDYEKTSF